MDSHDINLATNILDALECAKEALSLLPKLPPRMKPVHLRILNTIYRIRDDTGNSRVSDISKASGFLLPNATKFINELVELKVVEKLTSPSDKRVVLVRATEMGEQYIREYVLSFHEGLEKEFSKISESDRTTMIATIHEVYHAIQKSIRQ
jgi:DNA-binding MarR family transcriptional regulator